VFILAGPTASGKSGLAVALARLTGGEVVNADAFQLYRELPITTAQPPKDELGGVPHHLYGVLSVTESCDAARYRGLALPVIEDIRARGRLPIVVGGSGLYIKALTHGLAVLPHADPVLRAKLAELTARERMDELLRLDPDAASNVPLSNDRYVSRALEICILTGQPQSKLRQSWQQTPAQGQGIVLNWPREVLWKRIEARTEAMLAQGMMEEVLALPSDAQNASKAIGVPQIRDFAEGKLNMAALREAIVIATRQYAKRQSTWFRREQIFTSVEPSPDVETDAMASKLLEAFPWLFNSQ
jgi:tRNA dimethylallyltransferase